jgi:hypothetical protein
MSVLGCERSCHVHLSSIRSRPTRCADSLAADCRAGRFIHEQRAMTEAAPRARALRATTLFAPLLLAMITAFAGDPLITNQIINRFEDTFDAHPGQAASHANTLCVQGGFVGTPAASALSRSGLFGGEAVPVVAQFSVIGGNAGGRGALEMALEFRLDCLAGKPSPFQGGHTKDYRGHARKRDRLSEGAF